MKYIQDTNAEELQKWKIGGKAKNLFRLKNLGMTVPQFVIIPEEALLSLLPEQIQNDDYEELRQFIKQIIIPDSVIEELTNLFPQTKYFAVRSSATDEDGSDFSFAGQFESFLYVKPGNLAGKIRAVWISAYSQRVLEYRRHNELSIASGIAVIIQEMVDADVSGVAFGINPLNGKQDEKVINSVFGLGEGLVSGALNADHFILSKTEIIAELTEKTHQIILDREHESGTKQTNVPIELHKVACLNDHQIHEVGEILDKLQKEFGMPQDVEFAYKKEKLLLLQTRPVTTFQIANDKTGIYTLWDNSNIVESYPGVTTPLTFSFITTSYEGAYKQFSAYMGVSEKVINDNKRVFANTLGFINGRVYYNLKTWYHMLAMLPGYSINARFMEKMMGVKEKFDIPESYRLSKGKAWWSIFKMAVRMYMRFLSLPRKRDEFMALLNGTIATYKAIDFDKKNANELMDLYLEFEKTLLNEWKAPLLNDFFAMIWFGMLQKQCEKYFGAQNPNIHNDLLCGSSDIISVEPIHRSIKIASLINQNSSLKSIFLTENEQNILVKLQENPSYFSIKKEVDHYIADFGERCIGELKLETISYTQDPGQFIRILKSYVETGITTAEFSGKRENDIRQKAEQELDNTLKNKPLAKWKLQYILKNARELVSARENLRYERTRVFGIVRELFSHLGKRFYANQIIENDRDIFYLTKEEIFSYLDGTSVTQNLRTLISLRKKEFDGYQKSGTLSERFATWGTPYYANDFFSSDLIEKPEGGLKGIGCSPGRVTGKVRVVLNPSEVSSLNGDILVTSSTDPGWVTLFPGASGIIVERGSLLSHSAIVSREMGKPCIVSVTGLLKTLKTGDEIEMDGSLGTIRIISQ